MSRRHLSKGQDGRPRRDRSAQGAERASSDETRLVLGVHAVAELLTHRPDTVLALRVAPPPHRPALAELIAAARQRGLPVSFEPMTELDKRADGVRHQGAIALTQAFPYAELDGAVARLAQQPKALVVLLDSIQDPHNLGAIIRSATAFGADFVVLPKDRAAQITAAAERASAGTTSTMAIVRVVNLKRAMDTLKDAGFWLIGAGAHGGQALPGFDFPDRVGLVIGAEGEGLRAGIEATLDAVVTIPLAPRAESLNASNAAAVLLYEMSRGRTTPK